MSQELSIFSSKSNFEASKNNVDIICNEETCDSWVIADFHSEVENEQAKNLLKSFGAFSTLHVINVTFDDFNEVGEPEHELKDILEWYKGFYNSKKKSPHVILLFRDYLKKDEKKFEKVTNVINFYYTSYFMSLLKLANMSRNSFEDDDERKFKIKMFSEDQLKPILKKIA